MNHKDYYNYESDNRDIDLFKNELPLAYQYNTIGVPKDDELTSSPNTYQYTNANGQLRWRSGSKSTEELLEEERRRNQDVQAENESAQTQLGVSSSPDTSAPENPNQIDSSIMQEIEHVLKPLSVKDNIDAPIIDEASPYLLKGEVTKDALQQNLFEQLRTRVKDFVNAGFNKEDDLNFDFPRTHKDAGNAVDRYAFL
ncbi:MAG: hypothetical protein NC408_07860 [Candidatus Gastranaerophilales bacterium]|nr:hypothetical protein [Candidatus Gastranaerophilales bacterium]MCM1072590.1 hypothetical protein [Bacteroides sp.]